MEMAVAVDAKRATLRRRMLKVLCVQKLGNSVKLLANLGRWDRLNDKTQVELVFVLYRQVEQGEHGPTTECLSWTFAWLPFGNEQMV